MQKQEGLSINWKAVTADRLLQNGLSPKNTAIVITTIENVIADLIERAKEEERDRIRGYALSNITEPRYGMDTKWGDTDHPLIDFLDNHPQENEKSNTGKPAR